MHKIDTENATLNNEFQDADESQGILGTDLNSSWFNSVQRELCNVIEHFGQTLNADNDGQLLKSLMLCGIRTFNVDGGTVEVDSTWNGSSVMLCTAKNFEIDGYLYPGSLLVVVPIWKENSNDYINVAYGMQTVKLYKGQAFFGLCVNGETGVDLTVHKFVTSGSSDSTIVGKVVSDSLKSTSFIDAGYDQDIANYGDVYAPWQLASKWKVGQVKRVLSAVGTTESYKVNFFCNTSGSIGKVEFYPNSYREFICIGTYVKSDGNTYAVLSVNGLAESTNYES